MISRNVYTTKGENFGGSENFTVFPKIGIWGVTQKSKLPTPIESYLIFEVLKQE